MPLVETGSACLTLSGWDMWWQMKLFMIYALHFETWRKSKVAFWNGATTEDMNLRLYWDRRALGNPVEIDTVMVCQKRIMAMSIASRCFLWVEAALG